MPSAESDAEKMSAVALLLLDLFQFSTVFQATTSGISRSDTSWASAIRTFSFHFKQKLYFIYIIRIANFYDQRILYKKIF